MGLMLGFAHLGHMQGVGNIGADLQVHIEIAQMFHGLEGLRQHLGLCISEEQTCLLQGLRF